MRIKFMTLLVATIIIALALVPALALANNDTLCYKAHGVRQAVIEKHGKRAPGRNICRFGISDGRNATTQEKAKYLRALRRMNINLPYMVPGQPRVPPAGTATPRAALPYCTWGPESGGDYRASNGTHFGKYQFDLPTWQSVGGTGNPLNASPAEQDMRAAALYDKEGGRPWVNC